MSAGGPSGPVERRAEALYGHDLRGTEGVIHVASAWRSPAGDLVSLAINDATPESPTDAFVLALARARADALVTTGRILREEPALDPALSSAKGVAAADLLAYRRDVHGRSGPPASVVLTSGRDVDLDHPVLRGPQPRFLYTQPPSAERLAGPARDRGIGIVADEAPSLRGLLAWLTGERRYRTVVVEAGARTAADLYRDPVAVDELVLSLCRADRIDDRARGPVLPGEAEIARAGLVLRSECDTAEPSGPWTFRRYRR